MRKDPPFDIEYVYSTYLLERAEREGARVFNGRARSATTTRSWRSRSSREFIAPTLVTRDAALVHAFIDDARATRSSSRSTAWAAPAIFRVRADDPNRNVIVETVALLGRRTVMAQRYIPEIARRATSACCSIARRGGALLRSRASRSPARRAATSPPADAASRARSTPRDREIADALGPALWAEGLLVVGLDVIGDYLTEVNVTSPTCFVEIAQQTGFDVAGMFADALERAVGK